MEEELSVDHFKLWKVPQLRDFLRKRGLIHSSKRKDELVALVFAAYREKRPVVLTGTDVSRAKAADYQSLLYTKEGDRFPDPTDLTDGWKSEKTGMEFWPPVTQIDIASYLLSHVEDKNLNMRLMGDYKEGKGYSYFDSKWLKEVWYNEVNPKSSLCFLKSESTPSERLNAIPHKIWVAIQKKTGTIESAYCTCFAGLGSTCNHVAAILFKVEYAWQQGWTNKSCTSRPCVWNQYGASKHVLETKEISEMDWRKPHYSKKAKKTNINPASRALFSPRKKSSTQQKPSLDRIITCLFSSCPQVCAFQYANLNPQNVYPPDFDLNVSETVEITSSAQVPPSLSDIAKQSLSEEHFISKLPKFTADEIELTQKETCLQSESNEWKQQRQGRVTGSVAHRVMTRVNTITATPHKEHDVSSLLSQIMGYTSPPENLPALKYGRSMEAEARQSYRDSLISSGHVSSTVLECGLCLNTDKSFIAASPDGFVHCDCCGDGLLEIKCPVSIAHENPCNVELAYLQCTDGSFSLRKTHSYYSQVQFQLGVTQKTWCDFFVFTRFGHITIRVQFDGTRWKELVSAAEYFFYNHIASELVTRSLERKLKRAGKIKTGSPEIGPFDSMLAAGMPVITDTTPDVASTSDAVSPVKPQTNPTKPAHSTSGKRKGKGKRAKHSFSPLYSCAICGNLCKEMSEIIADEHNSVQCDGDNCGLWFHWSCVGFSDKDSDENWLCPFCL